MLDVLVLTCHKHAISMPIAKQVTTRNLRLRRLLDDSIKIDLQWIEYKVLQRMAQYRLQWSGYL